MIPPLLGRYLGIAARRLAAFSNLLDVLSRILPLDPPVPRGEIEESYMQVPDMSRRAAAVSAGAALVSGLAQTSGWKPAAA